MPGGLCVQDIGLASTGVTIEGKRAVSPFSSSWRSFSFPPNALFGSLSRLSGLSRTISKNDIVRMKVRRKKRGRGREGQE